MDHRLIVWFKDIKLDDIELAGGKNASLGEMYGRLENIGIKVPNGFAVTSAAYRFFLDRTGLRPKIEAKLKNLDTRKIPSLKETGRGLRKLILSAEVPEELKKEIAEAYRTLEKEYGRNADVAVRSSATAEDLPSASFAGQQETFLNIKGEKALTDAVKKCFASFFTDRAISYRATQKIGHLDAAISVGVQKMVRSDLGSSGVMFTLDTETGFDKAVVIESSYGLGEMVVQGRVSPDEFTVFKPTLGDFRPILQKNLGEKALKLIYSAKGTEIKKVTEADRKKFSITDTDVIELAKKAVKIEEHFSKKYRRVQPMDIEWAKDGKTGEIFILQARPETVTGKVNKKIHEEYKLLETGEIILTGVAVGSKIGQGRVRVVKSPREMAHFRKGEVLVAEITDPDWEPIMKIAGAIVTDKGGRTSHAAIVSRELGIPCVVGGKMATKYLKNGMPVTVDCSSGGDAVVYKGLLPFKIHRESIDSLPEIKTKIMLNIGSPDEAFKNSALPVKGVGLGRLEFIITSSIKAHPNALINYEELKKSTDPKIKRVMREVARLTEGYPDKKQFYIENLSRGIGKIAAAFHPHEVIIRFSDFKTNEYRSLLGGEFFEKQEENPMLGWRGASRYYHHDFKRAFGLECLAIKKVREEMGLKNVVPMVPFCRTPEEGETVVRIMKENGLDRAKDETLKIYMMCEIPSNVILADQFLDTFDGMSIGSNDLTQLMMGMDRDSHVISGIANETNPAVMEVVKNVIKKCLARKKYIGICGQAPSDHPEFAKFLVKEGIESISLNPDVVIKTILAIAEDEKGLSFKVQPVK